MCELFGFSGKKKRKLNNDLKEFFSHSKDNPDGWGLASFGKKSFFIEKEHLPAHKSQRLKKILDKKIESDCTLAHIRFATIGYDEYNNSHPFWGFDKSDRMWTLIHNGTIFDGDVLSKYSYFQKGATDSERLFMYIINSINEEIEKKKRELDFKERFDIIEKIVNSLSNHNKLNLLIYDGQQLYVHTNCKDTLYKREDDYGITFSTNPLSEQGWQPHEFRRLVAYQGGKEVFSSKKISIEYIPNEKDIRALFLAYSGL